MLEKFWFPFHSSVFHINKAWVIDFTRPVFWKTTLAHKAWRRKRRPERRASFTESEAEEGTVGKRTGPQGLRMQPLFQASHLSCRKEGAEPCCHQRSWIRIPSGRNSHIHTRPPLCSRLPKPKDGFQRVRYGKSPTNQSTCCFLQGK